jgi:hypothetical protein
MSIRKADILENILHHLKSKNPTAIFHIFGWIRPEPMTQWFAQFGSSFHETLLGNLSWHSSFRVAPKRLQLKSNVLPDTVVVRNNYYLVFIGTEGDAGNWNFGFQSGAWLSAQRGNIPLAWGWNLQLLALCPFVVQYYFDTATPKDGFISVTSPLGYAYPDLWGNDVWNNAVDSSRRLTDEFSIREFYAYKHYAAAGTMVYRGKTINNSFNFTKLGAFQKAISANMTFLFDPMLQTQTPNTAYGSLLFNHVNDGTFYGDASNLNSMAANILGLIRNKPKPYFLLAGYQRLRQDNFSGRSAPSSGDINIPRLQQLIALLAADTSTGRAIEVVTPQYFSALLRKKLGLPNTAEEETDRLPAELRLWQNYPNPFNPATVIRYHVPGNGQQSTACVSPQKALTDNPSTANGTRVRFVSLNIYDALGSIVARLVNELQPEGTHEVLFNGAGLPSGIYFYALHIDGYTQTRKMALLK